MTTYYEKLKSPLWQKKRLDVLNSSGFSCDRCCDDSEQLHVHHKIYKKGLNPWEYPNYNYSVLCDSCHKEAHVAIDGFNDFFGTLDVKGHFDQKGILELILGFYLSDDNFQLNSDQQTQKLLNIDSEYDLDSDSYPRILGEFLRVAISNNKPDYKANNRLEECNLSKEDLARIFTNIAVNFSRYDVEYFEKCSLSILGESSE